MKMVSRIVGAFGTVWYLFGGSQFIGNFMIDIPAQVASGAMNQAHADGFLSIPSFIWGLYGIAVVAGIIGGVQLLRLKANAWLFFGAALICDVVYFGWIRFVAYTSGDRPAEAGILAVVVLSVGTILFLASLWIGRTAQGHHHK